MTSKTSLFNKGIYKSTVKRCLWGSALYFIILFLAVTLPWLSDESFYSRFGNIGSLPTILNYSYFTFPMIMTWFVPTVTGLLVYRFMHSKKTSVFTHSLPVSRNAIYFSSLLAGLTLMLLPVIANGLIMALTSAATLDITLLWATLVWTGMNLLALFLMFSAVSFAASLTGNSFAMVAINILVHAVLYMLAALFGFMAEEYIFGFTTSNTVLQSLAEGNFPVLTIMFADNIDVWFTEGMTTGEILKMLVFAGSATALYALGWLLYKKRNLENAEDVAGFKVLNPIFKYLLTFMVTLASISADWNILTTVILTAVTYFGCEMLLKKTMKVWKSYKGLALFAALFIVFAGYIAFGSFFGFEKYVPSADTVEQALIYNSHGNYTLNSTEYYKNPDLIADITEIHKEIVTDSKYFYRKNPGWRHNYELLRIKYQMKNGKTVSREYRIPNDAFEFLKKLYKYEEFKGQNVLLLRLKNNGYLYYIHSEISFTDKDAQTVEHAQIEQLHRALCDDLAALDYEQLYSGKYMNCSVSITVDSEFMGRQREAIDIREDFTNTLNWLRENGYME